MFPKNDSHAKIDQKPNGTTTFNETMENFRQKKKNQILSELGYIQFKLNNEKEYLNEIAKLKKEISAQESSLHSERKHFRTMKIKSSNLIEALTKQKEELETKLQEEIQLKEIVKDEIEALKNQHNQKIKGLEGELKLIKEENHKIQQKINNDENKIKELEEKTVSQLSNIFDLKMKIDEIEKINKENKEELCCICLESSVSYACVPCGHKKYCEKCINAIQECSICKKFIRSKLKIF